MAHVIAVNSKFTAGVFAEVTLRFTDVQHVCSCTVLHVVPPVVLRCTCVISAAESLLNHYYKCLLFVLAPL
jgi:hypothetical protein